MTAPPILYCKTCGCDTLPLKTGCCAFCDSRLVAKPKKQRKPPAPKPRKVPAWYLRRLARLEQSAYNEVHGSVARVEAELRTGVPELRRQRRTD